jgi:hypothetical protein
LEVEMLRSYGEMPKQSPFAVVVGCSDARVPTEMIFGQVFNDLSKEMKWPVIENPAVQRPALFWTLENDTVLRPDYGRNDPA